MRHDFSDITLVVDRSGSMSHIKEDAEGGINEFIQSQAKEPGDAVLTLVQFDTEYEFIHRAMPVEQVPKFKLQPRGMTALLDAVGRAIRETETRIGNMTSAEQPGLIVFVIMTDGHENSSIEFSKQEVKRLIEQFQSDHDWQFIFLGADQNSFSEANSMGIDSSRAARYSKSKIRSAFQGTCNVVGRLRGQSRKGERLDANFTVEERESME